MFVLRNNRLKGITLIELMITVLAVMILIVGISGILAAGHKNYNTMFKRVNSEVVRNAYEARSIFDRIVRQSIREYQEINDEGDDLTVFYYSDPNNILLLSDYPNRYANFYLGEVDDDDDDELIVDIGVLNLVVTDEDWSWNRKEKLSTLTLAHNVISVEFTIVGASIRMSLTLDNENVEGNPNKLETLDMDVTTTAIRHNKLPDT